MYDLNFEFFTCVIVLSFKDVALCALKAAVTASVKEDLAETFLPSTPISAVTARELDSSYFHDLSLTSSLHDSQGCKHLQTFKVEIARTAAAARTL